MSEQGRTAFLEQKGEQEVIHSPDYLREKRFVSEV